MNVILILIVPIPAIIICGAINMVWGSYNRGLGDVIFSFSWSVFVLMFWGLGRLAFKLGLLS